MPHRRSLLCLATATAGLVAIAGCGGSNSSSNGSASSPYVVGAVTSLSGSLAFIGNALKGGSAAYYDYLNAHGGVNGHPVKFIALDDAGDASTALSSARQLTEQNHAVALSGWVLTNIESAVLPYAQRQQIAMVAQGCDTTIASASNKVAFCASAPIPLEDGPELSFAAQKVGSASAKVAVLDMNSLSQVQLQKRIVAGAKAKGWQVVVQKLVALDSSNMSAEASAVERSGATIVVGSLDTQREQLFDQALRTLGSKIPIVNYDGGAAMGTLQALKDPRLFVYSGNAFPSDPGAAVQAYDTQMKASGADPAAGFAINGYVEAIAITAGLKACGWPCSSAKFVQTMQGLGTVSTDGVTTSPLKYSSDYHFGITGGKFYAWSDSAGHPAQVSDVLPLASS